MQTRKVAKKGRGSEASGGTKIRQPLTWLCDVAFLALQGRKAGVETAGS